MRNAFARVITELAEKHEDIVLLVGDIGNRLFDEYKERYSNRFYNCGIAEAGMTGIASGLASCGLLPVTYTITPFNTIRCLEQIRLDVCYPNHPVIIVGVGSGLSYGALGATHHSLEDIGCLRLLPNMHIVCPADQIEVELAMKDSIRLRRPTYIRLGKKGEPKVHDLTPEFTIGKAITIREGEHIAILGVGNMVSVALEVADKLQEKNISPRVVSFHTIKPLDGNLLRLLFSNYSKIAILEEHGVAGGAGSAVLEWASRTGIESSKLICFGVGDKFLTGYGNQLEARQAIGLDATTIAKALMRDEN